jgi:hypothetical protein
MMQFFTSLWTKLFSRLRTDRGGHFGTATAILILPLMVTAGLAVDLSFAFSTKESLQAAADAAALNAVRNAAREEVTRGGSDRTVVFARLGEEARKVFGESIPENVRGFTSFDVQPVFRYEDGILQADLTYTGRIDTNFLRIIGYNSIGITGTASAKSDSFQYIQFHMMLDNSPSMGMDAYPADNTPSSGTAVEPSVKVVESTPLDNCMFACHLPDIYNSPTGSFANLMRGNGKTLRMDVAKDAMSGLGAVMEDERVRANQFRVTLYSFGDYQGNVFAKPFVAAGGMTADMNQFRTLVAEQDVIRVPSGYPLASTDYPGIVRAFNQTLPTSQNGAFVGKPRLVVMMLVGGLADPGLSDDCWHPTTPGSLGVCAGPMSLSDCDALKARSIDIAILYMPYVPLPAVPVFGSIGAIPDPLAPNLDACASEDYYVKSNPAAVGSDLQDLLRKIIHRPRLLG